VGKGKSGEEAHRKKRSPRRIGEHAVVKTAFYKGQFQDKRDSCKATRLYGGTGRVLPEKETKIQNLKKLTLSRTIRNYQG